MKFVANAAVFCVVYLILMIPTYVFPYLGSNSAAMVAIQSVEVDSVQDGTLFFTFTHLACLAGLIFITFLRGKWVGKVWLIIFPILAAVFDFIPGLSIIPLVPTVMHLCAMIFGFSASPHEKQVSP
ncbi:MAG: hypothetical protein AAGI44_07210 [Pseudomonadota bacterium]